MQWQHWVFATQCPICGIFQADSNICAACFYELSFITNACKKCQQPFDYNVLDIDMCAYCAQEDRAYYSSMVCALRYNEMIKNLVVRFKNHANFYLGDIFAKLILNAANNDIFKDAILVPVPLFKKRLIWRGYNQSLILANKMAAVKNIQIMPHLLTRIRDTNSQGTKKLKERFDNISGAFAVNSPKFVKNKKFIIIDDVITTGATMFECAQTLYRYGAKEIHLVALARRLKRSNYLQAMPDYTTTK